MNNPQPKQPSEKWFRKDIEGLRAIAVIAVIFYHADLGFQGGFTGVDFFFVISGYLILRIISQKIIQGTFSLADFYTRRIKRIVPLSLFVLITTSCASFILMNPSQFSVYYASAKATVLMIANFFFSHLFKTNYFVDSSSWHPLLHTWSLSVEEQFYLIIPILLVLIYKTKPKNLTLGLTILTVVSLYLCLTENPETAFFTPWTRAWEFSFIGIIATLEVTQQLPEINKNFANILVSFGFLGILYSVFFLNHAVTYPSLITTIPVLSISFIITAHIHHKTFLYQALASKTMQQVGKISYSLYLWHWPILVLRKYIFLEDSFLVKTLCLLLTLLCSVGSYKFIENPFRYSRLLKQTRYAFMFLVFSIISTLIFLKGQSLIQPDISKTLNSNTTKQYNKLVGVPKKLPNQVHLRIQDFTNQENPLPLNLDYIILGDSHADRQAYTIANIASQHDLKGAVVHSPHYLPIPGIWCPNTQDQPPYLNFQQTNAATQNIINFIIKNRVSHVIIINRWREKIDPTSIAAKSQESHARGSNSLVSNNEKSVHESFQAQTILEEHLSTLLTQFSQKNIQVWIMQQVPTTTQSFRNKYKTYLRFPNLNTPPNTFVIKQEALKEQEESRTLISTIGKHKAKVLDPYPYLFKESDKVSIQAKDKTQLYYSDSNHISINGVDHFLTPMWEQVLSSIAATKANPNVLPALGSVDI